MAAAVTKAALAHPAVAFTLRSSGRETLDAPAAVDRGARILQVFGVTTLGELELFEARSGGLRLLGYATRGASHVSDAPLPVPLRQRPARSRIAR